MSYNRNDISAFVMTDGSVYITQGNPSYEKIDQSKVADQEHGLYHSQLYHRMAWEDPDGSYQLGTPTQYKASQGTGAIKLLYGRTLGQEATGHPFYVGKVK